MIPVNQFILGGSDPLLYPSEKMTNSIDEQIAFLQSQKQAINEAYRRNAIPNANNGNIKNQMPREEPHYAFRTQYHLSQHTHSPHHRRHHRGRRERR